MIDRLREPLTFVRRERTSDSTGQAQPAERVLAAGVLCAVEPVGTLLPDVAEQLRPGVRWEITTWRTEVLAELAVGDVVRWTDGREAEIESVLRGPLTMTVTAVERQ